MVWHGRLDGKIAFCLGEHWCGHFMTGARQYFIAMVTCQQLQVGRFEHWCKYCSQCMYHILYMAFQHVICFICILSNHMFCKIDCAYFLYSVIALESNTYISITTSFCTAAVGLTVIPFVDTFWACTSLTITSRGFVPSAFVFSFVLLCSTHPCCTYPPFSPHFVT